MNVRPKEKTDTINLRVSPAEKEQLKTLAAAAGLSLSAFLLSMALGDKIGQMIIDGFDKRYVKNG